MTRKALRFSLFERHLSAPHLKAYVKQLSDFEDVEAENGALTQVERHSNVHAALAFLTMGALNRAARVVDARIKEIDGDLYELLDPGCIRIGGQATARIGAVAPALHRFHAAEGALHALPARSAPCAGDRQPAVRHQRLWRHESHVEFMARLKREHSRKPAFWSLLAK